MLRPPFLNIFFIVFIENQTFIFIIHTKYSTKEKYANKILYLPTKVYIFYIIIAKNYFEYSDNFYVPRFSTIFNVYYEIYYIIYILRCIVTIRVIVHMVL